MERAGKRREGLVRWWAGWSLDWTDPARLATVRARLIAWASAAVAVAVAVESLLLHVVDPVLTARFGRLASIAAVAYFALAWAVAARLRERLDDRMFHLLICASLVLAGLTAMLGDGGGGSTARAALGMTVVVITGAVFSGWRWQVAVQVLVADGMLLLMVATARSTVDAGTDLGTGLMVLGLTAVVVRLLRDQSAAALASARRGEVTDPLTGLNNRRGAERHAERCWPEQARAGSQVAVLVIDVDHFKEINDALGHAAGDEILRRLAGVVTANLRLGDVAVRMGGEEFLVLCEVPPPKAEVVAERLREAIEAELAPVTVSIGVHVTWPEAEQDGVEALWSAVEHADRALHEAKRAGRNRVVMQQA